MQQKTMQDYVSRLASLKAIRAQHEPTLKAINRYIAPNTARFSGRTRDDGLRDDGDIINTAPLIARRTLASGMQSGITSPLRPWFKLTLPDKDMARSGKIRQWLDDVERIMRTLLARSNFYSTIKRSYRSSADYGTALLSVMPDKQDIMRFHDVPMGSYYLATDGTGRLTSVYIEREFTTYELVSLYGLEKCPRKVRDAYGRANYEAKHSCLLVVEPNELHDAQNPLASRKKYKSVCIVLGVPADEAIVYYKGYDMMPFLPHRWDLSGDNVWGIGCGHDALGDAKQLQFMERKKLVGLEKMFDPPMVADASLMNQRIGSMAGETVYVNGLITGNQAYKPQYQVDTPINLIQANCDQIAQRIDSAYYKDLFLMVAQFADQPNITATQINVLKEEKLLMLGPVLEGLNDDLLDPLIDLAFYYMVDNELLPPPPPEIQNMPLSVEYVSFLAQAQKTLGVGNIERLVGFVGQVSAAYPQARFKLDVNKTIDEYADAVGAPAIMVVDTEDANEQAQAEQQAAQMQQLAQSAPALNQMASAAKTMTETDPNTLRQLAGL